MLGGGAGGDNGMVRRVDDYYNTLDVRTVCIFCLIFVVFVRVFDSAKVLTR